MHSVFWSRRRRRSIDRYLPPNPAFSFGDTKLSRERGTLFTWQVKVDGNALGADVYQRRALTRRHGWIGGPNWTGALLARRHKWSLVGVASARTASSIGQVLRRFAC